MISGQRVDLLDEGLDGGLGGQGEQGPGGEALGLRREQAPEEIAQRRRGPGRERQREGAQPGRGEGEAHAAGLGVHLGGHLQAAREPKEGVAFIPGLRLELEGQGPGLSGHEGDLGEGDREGGEAALAGEGEIEGGRHLAAPGQGGVDGGQGHLKLQVGGLDLPPLPVEVGEAALHVSAGDAAAAGGRGEEEGEGEQGVSKTRKGSHFEGAPRALADLLVRVGIGVTQDAPPDRAEIASAWIGGVIKALRPHTRRVSSVNSLWITCGQLANSRAILHLVHRANHDH